MSCKPSRILIWTLCLSFLVTGCSPVKPNYLRDTGDLSYYLDQATMVEYPDVDMASLDEVTQSFAPITVIDPDFSSFYDLTLEDCVSIALQNSKVLRGYGTPSLQGTRVAPGQDTLANGPAAAGTVYNVAVRESEPGFIGIPGQISSPATITTNTALEGNIGVEAALADFDAQFTTTALWQKSDEPRNATPILQNGQPNPFDPQVFQQDGVQWNSEIAKKTANGTQIFFRQTNLYTNNNIPLVGDGGFQVLDSWYRTAFEVEFRQPLLRGRGAFIQRMPVVISRIGSDQELANLEAQLQNMVTNIEIRYWELYCAYRNLEASKTGRNAALETWRIVKDRYDEGADVNIQQVAQASGQYHFFNSQVTDALNNVLTAEGNLRYLLGIAATDGRVIRPIDEAMMAPVEFDWCSSLCEALTYRPELRQERWEIKKRELALAYSKNGLLPELNVTALYRWLGLGNKYGTSQNPNLPFPDPTSGALNELYRGDFQELQLGGEYRMPIGFRRELANVRNAQLKLAREIARLEDMELDVSRELSEAMRALAANLRIMHSSFNNWKDTQIEEDHFLELKDAGVETLDVALDAQRRRAQAEQSFYNALCEYNKVISLVHRRKGTILVYNGIEFSEGPWPGKAYSDASEHARRRGASRHLNYGWSRPQVISRGQGGPQAENNGTILGGTPLSTSTPIHDLSAPADQGVPMIESPYYSPSELLPPTEPQSTPEPTLAPQQLPPPKNQGSSSRVFHDSSVQQTSYAEPISQPILKLSAAPRQPENTVRETQTKSPLRTTNNSKHEPVRDSQPPTATRLKAVPRTQNSTAEPANRRPAAMDWEKFGLSNPERSTRTTAEIKKSN